MAKVSGMAVAKAVESITEEEIAQVTASRQQEKAAHEKEITDPETFDQWRLYVRHQGGYQSLSAERKIAYERICADHTRSEPSRPPGKNNWTAPA